MHNYFLMHQKYILPFVETMATQVCNLSCLGCTNYSDLKHTGYVPWTEMQSQIKEWLEILEFLDFGIIGGEPLINPEIEQWITGVRELMPTSQIRFTTNGLLLKKYPNLLNLLNYIGNCVFKITVHKSDPYLEDFLKDTLSSGWEPVMEFGINRWRNKHGVKFQINRPTEFIKTYKNNFNDMEPHRSDPTTAFNNCIQQTCPLLYNRKIYKCSTSGLLLDTLNKLNRPNWNAWEPLIEKGISVDSSTQEILEFINNFGKPHPRCCQCPTGLDAKIIHLENV